MDAFEQIVEILFRQKGYWTQTSYRINLTKEDKRAIGKPSLPRPEIDILAYKPVENELLWIECKSYLDSEGVRFIDLIGEGKYSRRYKIFTDNIYREMVEMRLLDQVVIDKLCLPNPSLKYCLVAGNVYGVEADKIAPYFEEQGWQFFDRSWVRDKLHDLAQLGYENNTAIIVAKLFSRE